jgi:hypothetical protein
MLKRGRCPKGLSAASCDEHFLAYEMESNHFRFLVRVEVAIDRVADVGPQFFQFFTLGEYGFSKGAGRVAAFDRIFH